MIMEDFNAHGSYTISNSGGYLVELSDCGDMARLKDSFGSDNPQVSDWLDIEFISNEDDDLIAVIDPNEHHIPLSEVIRINI